MCTDDLTDTQVSWNQLIKMLKNNFNLKKLIFELSLIILTWRAGNKLLITITPFTDSLKWQWIISMVVFYGLLPYSGLLSVTPTYRYVIHVTFPFFYTLLPLGSYSWNIIYELCKIRQSCFFLRPTYMVFSFHFVISNCHSVVSLPVSISFSLPTRIYSSCYVS